LGLPVSQKIIREHGGQLLVQSQPGHGARFTFELPAMLPKEDSSPTESATILREAMEQEAGE
jgi:K+-sensing histidine kinase KdpD